LEPILRIIKSIKKSGSVFKVLSSQLPESILEAEVNEGLVEVDGRLGLEQGDLQLQVSGHHGPAEGKGKIMPSASRISYCACFNVNFVSYKTESNRAADTKSTGYLSSWFLL
jgi:hypothetical protein